MAFPSALMIFSIAEQIWHLFFFEKQKLKQKANSAIQSLFNLACFLFTLNAVSAANVNDCVSWHRLTSNCDEYLSILIPETETYKRKKKCLKKSLKRQNSICKWALCCCCCLQQLQQRITRFLCRCRPQLFSAFAIQPQKGLESEAQIKMLGNENEEHDSHTELPHTQETA